MKKIHILLAVLTLAFIMALAVLSIKDRQEHPVEWMTEAEAFAIYGRVT